MKDRALIHTAAASPVDTDGNAAFLEGTLGSSARAFRDEALISPLISIGRNGLRGYQSVRSPGALRLHPAFNELNLADWLIHSESQGKPKDVHEPILITNQGILLAGFAEWHAAVCAGHREIVCIEFALNVQERYFQSKALANQIAGGKHKGLANLPKAQQIDVREKIADLAGASPRTVGNVKVIRKKAHPSLIEALHNGTITINVALEICEFDTTRQVEELARFLAKRANRKTYREYIDKLQVEQFSADLGGFFAKLQQFEATKPGSLEVRPGTGKKTVIIVGKDYLSTMAAGTPAGLR